VRTTPLHLALGPEPVLGFLHEPGAEPDPPRAPVLLLGPFGWEDMCSYRARRDWAGHLAGRGHRVLRLDLPATGDSAG
jgi:pimeloyl-ACP methyl ester carboxylesterase